MYQRRPRMGRAGEFMRRKGGADGMGRGGAGRNSRPRESEATQKPHTYEIRTLGPEEVASELDEREGRAVDSPPASHSHAGLNPTLRIMPLIVDQLNVQLYPDRAAMGRAAAARAHAHVRDVVAARGRARVILSSAPSQDDFYAALADLAGAEPAVWAAATVYHMDEYAGLAPAHAQSFSRYLQEHFLQRVEVAAFHPIRGDAPDAEAEARRYAALLEAAPIDLIGLGIGENGHIAFNDPPVADFADPVAVKVVEMDRVCRQQQVNDGCFPTIEAVPRRAISITLPVFARAGMLSCHVPTTRKAAAVAATLTGPVGRECPATLLRQHPNAWLHLDPAAASQLPAALREEAAVRS